MKEQCRNNDSSSSKAIAATIHYILCKPFLSVSLIRGGPTWVGIAVGLIILYYCQPLREYMFDFVFDVDWFISVYRICLKMMIYIFISLIAGTIFFIVIPGMIIFDLDRYCRKIMGAGKEKYDDVYDMPDDEYERVTGRKAKKSAGAYNGTNSNTAYGGSRSQTQGNTSKSYSGTYSENQSFNNQRSGRSSQTETGSNSSYSHSTYGSGKQTGTNNGTSQGTGRSYSNNNRTYNNDTGAYGNRSGYRSSSSDYSSSNSQNSSYNGSRDYKAEKYARELEEARSLYGIDKNHVSKAELTKTRNRLARRYHPDAHQDNKEYYNEMMRKINNGYEILVKHYGLQ